jgi:flagellar basal-body rod protein FlgB
MKSGGMFRVVDALGSAMTFHRRRHSVLAGNLANLDTPGYRPSDLRRVKAVPFEVQLSRTHPRHLLPPGAALAADTGETYVDQTTTPGPDGNAVSLERELAKVDANRVGFSTAAELVAKKLALLKYGAGGGM